MIDIFALLILLIVFAYFVLHSKISLTWSFLLCLLAIGVVCSYIFYWRPVRYGGSLQFAGFDGSKRYYGGQNVGLNINGGEYRHGYYGRYTR